MILPYAFSRPKEEVCPNVQNVDPLKVPRTVDVSKDRGIVLKNEDEPALRERTLTGAVLAGGRSCRLGKDKCALVLGAENVDMLTRTARLVQRVLGAVHIVGREHPAFPFLLDDVPGKGPVGAVTTFLRQRKNSCLVLSCDLPFMDERVLFLLVNAWKRRKPGILQTLFRHTATGKRENLVAVYEPGALRYLEPCLRDDLLKIDLAVPNEFRCFVPVPPYAEDAFFNINTPDNLREALRRMAGPAKADG
jgi:molybdopterin-guanine dinucleotide biosynthesis protein A